jgi:Sec-independent protein translocase protein TatA
MFDVSELALLATIGLLVLGPKRLQKVVGELGKWIGSARRTATQLYRQLERETKFEQVFQRPGRTLRVVPRPANSLSPPAITRVASTEVGAVTEANPVRTESQPSNSSDLPNP